MKIRIFALAKELGLENKVLIDYCAQAGIKVKASALASISPEERDAVVQYIEQLKSGGSSEPATDQPARETTQRVGKKVRTIPTGSGTSRPADSPVEETSSTAEEAPAATTVATAVVEEEAESATEVEAEETVVEETVAAEIAAEEEVAEAVETEETAADEVEAEAATEEKTQEVAEDSSATTEKTTSRKEDEPPAEVVAKETVAKTDSSETATKETEETKTKPTKGTKKKADDKKADDKQEDGKNDDVDSAATTEKKPEPSTDPAKAAPTRENPINPTPQRNMRVMKPRGTVRDADAGRKGGKGKPKATPMIATLPEVAAPKKTPKKEEAPAQRPEMKLTPGMLEHSGPLSEHVKRHHEDGGSGGRKGGRRGIKDEDREGGPKQSLRQKRQKQQQEEEQSRHQRRIRPRRRKKGTSNIPLKTSATIELPISIRSLSEAIGRPAKTLMGILFKDHGQMVTINDFIDEEMALALALEVGVDLEIKHGHDIEDDLQARLEGEDPAENLSTRPPIITILGHVDHGKTSLLDKLRETSVASGEAGGITQHIASYQVDHNGQKLTFVDTPGHAAFGEMRARGANVTDIIVLVVAADDGVMPQTIECISHAKAAGVPMVVAMNKIDLPDTNEQRVLQELTAQEVLPAEWGGDVEVVRTSAETGQGLEDLLETLLLTAELHEFQSNFDAPAHGVCLEAFQDEGRGIVSWLIVQKGTLRVGDSVVCGTAFGKIRAIYNDQDVELQEAGPSTPVKISGMDSVPGAGDHFFVMDSIDAAREVAEERRDAGRNEALARRGRKAPAWTDILQGAREGRVQDLPVIIKADSPGSLEALRTEIEKFEHDEVRVEIVHEGVGGVNESDVYLASASGAIVIAFYVIAEDRAQQLAESEGVEIRRYRIIYEVIDRIKRDLEGMLEPEQVEVSTGRALVLRTFSVSRTGVIAGCRILNGSIERNGRVHVIRDQKVLNNYPIASLRREKDDVKDVREGMECGIRLDGFNDVKEGDLLEAYRVDEIKRTLD